MIEFRPNTLNQKILTDSGYQSFAGIALMGYKPIVKCLFTKGKFLECTADHKVFLYDGEEIEVQNLVPRQRVKVRGGGFVTLKSVTPTGNVEPVYDIIEVDGGHRYYTNDILSSNCEFVTDDETLIDSIKLSLMTGRSPDFFTTTVRWFTEPTPNCSYLVALDPSLGTGGDYAAIQVFRMPDMEQIAEWQHNRTDPRGQVVKLLQTLAFIDSSLRDDPLQHGEPDIYWTIENNTIGEAILVIIEDTGEERFPGTFVHEKKRKGQTRRFRKGLNTDNKKKLSACARLKSLIDSRRMTINSQLLIRQLKFFVRAEGSYAGKGGEHDDLVSATLLVARMLDIVLGYGVEAGDLREYISDEDICEDEPMPMVF